ncbi:uncharacterized protein ACLA_054920 [Aspergillus clavatus NRRL 1]|uniref:Uncharacterized protein n=1 Tax=Aspergillus clavatus (strain ATCC 1007 / CBS 513.65 / DSM 816 / NCTC 3887 / NRRL 1 / QM 1276 / 107) TaxID=344612 RepID=A1C9C1_ASPCL|nr:uncharacterized protein ACLA_054920 [Aspergillus clavatus NRRL 1]EAW13445.1 hypothetical protein ACLA_054920 [Aspergillus clavatus NRRL 1]
MDLQLKKHKQNRRKNIARELNRDVASIDSDEERKWVNKIFEDIDAEEKRRQGLSPAERRREDIQSSARALKELVNAHFGPYTRRPYAAFLLQEAPESRRGAKCQLHHCEKSIWPGDYRIKVDDGKQWTYFPAVLKLS